MSKKKQPKQRSYVAYDMIIRSQRAGLHADLKRQANKDACREPIDLEDWNDSTDDSEGSTNNLSDGLESGAAGEDGPDST